MAHEIDVTVPRDERRGIKPAYQRPVLTELDIEETATGVQVGSPENISYSS